MPSSPAAPGPARAGWGAVYLNGLLPARAGWGAVYLNGLPSNVCNPKIGVFFVAFLPGFIPARVPATLFTLGLGLWFIAETGAGWPSWPGWSPAAPAGCAGPPRNDGWSAPPASSSSGSACGWPPRPADRVVSQLSQQLDVVPVVVIAFVAGVKAELQLAAEAADRPPADAPPAAQAFSGVGPVTAVLQLLQPVASLIEGQRVQVHAMVLGVAQVLLDRVVAVAAG